MGRLADHTKHDRSRSVYQQHIDEGGRSAAYTNSINPGSNLTNTSLPALCNTLAANVRDNFPTSCSYFFQDSYGCGEIPLVIEGILTCCSALDGLGWPLTSNGDNYDVVLNPNCTINDNGTWQNAVSLYNNDSQAVYTAWSQAVTPILFAFMPGGSSCLTAALRNVLTLIKLLTLGLQHESRAVLPN